MHGRYWVHVIAAGLLVVSGWSALAQQQPPAVLEEKPVAAPGEKHGGPAGDQGAAAKQDPPAGLVPILKGIEAAIRESKAEEDKAERQGQRDREVADLKAQEEMARWAFWMFVASGATVLLTFAALIAIMRTLHHTRRAADSSQKMASQAELSTAAAIAAANSTAEAVRISQQDGRAWLMVQNAVTNVTIIDNGYLHMDVNFKCENVGRTIATDVAMQGFAVTLSVKEYATRDFSREVERIEDAGRIADPPLKTIIAPTRTELLHTLTRSEIDVSQAEPAGPRVGKMIVVLFVAVSYRGIGNTIGRTTRAFKADLHVFENDKLRHLGGTEPDHPHFEPADYIHHWMH